MAHAKRLCVQFQPRRAPSLAVDVVAGLLASCVTADGVRELFVERGRSDAWVNFTFTSSSTARTWTAVQAALRHRRWGRALQQSTIVTCQGSRGWDDYNLLHHFDAGEPLDRLTAARVKR